MFCGLASGLSLCNLVINHSGMRATEQNSILVRMAVCSSESSSCVAAAAADVAAAVAAAAPFAPYSSNILRRL